MRERTGAGSVNEEIILSMVKPYVKNGAITYDEFDKLFSILSRREQYAVTDVLYRNGIELVDAALADDILPLDVDDAGAEPEAGGIEILCDESIFQDREARFEPLVVYKDIRQTNETLCSLIQQGSRQAAQDLCVKNRRLVDKYAIAYEKRYGNRLDFEDLEQAGYWGLIKAAEKFSAQQGTVFSTYAVFWIKQSISREIMDNGYAIRIPVHMLEMVNRVVALYNELDQEGVPANERIPQFVDRSGYLEESVRECLRLKRNLIGYTSLDAPVGEEGDTELSDLVPDEECSVEDAVFQAALRHEMEDVLMTLTPREQGIM